MFGLAAATSVWGSSTARAIATSVCLLPKNLFMGVFSVVRDVQHGIREVLRSESGAGPLDEILIGTLVGHE